MASTSKQIVIAFDLYGTLLSTSSIAEKLAEHFGKEVGTKIATTWRTLQLEYTWRLNSMHVYQPFSDVTRNSLRHALTEHEVNLKDAQIEELMHAYDGLSTFDDVNEALSALQKEKDITAVVFSNGTQSMVKNSVEKSPDLSPHAAVFKQLVVVEQVKRYKPDPEVYKHLARSLGKQTDSEGMKDIWLVSGNPFDVVGAATLGMKTAWVDRNGSGWTDRLGSGKAAKPTVIVKGLGEVVKAVREHS